MHLPTATFEADRKDYWVKASAFKKVTLVLCRKSVLQGTDHSGCDKLIGKEWKTTCGEFKLVFVFFSGRSG